MKRMTIVLLGQLLVTLLALLPAMNVRAESLPTQGTFDGVYHRDRWGVGHFKFFIVHPSLSEKLGKYEGHRIRLTVAKGDQPMNPGPSIMLAIGDVDVLDDSPLSLELRTIPDAVPADKAFQIVCLLKNAGKDSLCVENGDAVISVRTPQKQGRTNEPSWLFKEYSRAQLSIAERSVQMNEAAIKDYDGSYDGYMPRRSSIVIPSGDVFPFVVILPDGLPTGEYEIEAWARAQKQRWGDYLPEDLIWARLDIPKPGTTPEPLPLKVLAKSVIPTNGYYQVNLTLACASQQTCRVAVCTNKESRVLACRLWACGQDETSIPLDVEPLVSNKTDDLSTLQLQQIPENGMPVGLRFRTWSRFAPSIKRLCLGALTELGVQTMVVDEAFMDVQSAAATSFGEPENGVKMRIRAEKNIFKHGERLTFHVQCVNETNTPVVWRMASGGLGENVIFQIDGHSITQPAGNPEFVYGWAGKWMTAQPYEYTVIIPETIKLNSGKHKFRYAFRSPGGTYKNSNNTQVPILNGIMASNEIEFVIE